MKAQLLLLCILLLFLISCSSKQQGGSKNYESVVNSPNGDVAVSVEVVEGEPEYYVRYKGKVLIAPSKLGVIFEEVDLNNELTLDYTEVSRLDETWTQPWGEQKDIRNNYEEIKLHFTKNESGEKMNLTFRVFDDGIGFRYEWPEQEGLQDFVITDEVTEFNMVDWSLQMAKV